MAIENTAQKQSFFKDYFLFKLRRSRAYTITFAVLNVLIYIAPVIFILILVATGGDGMSLHIGTYLATAFVCLALAAECSIIIVMTAVNLKAFHSRSAMDTLGALPLTTPQRFWGDMLSGLAAYMFSFVPSAVCSLILAAVLQVGYMPENTFGSYFFVMLNDNLIGVAAMLILTLFICTLATFAMTSLVSSCSGKLGISIVFSFVALFAIPIIILSVCGYVAGNVPGLSERIERVMFGSINAIPPVGTAVGLINDLFLDMQSQYVFPAQSPRLIIMLAFIAVPMLGAYLAATRRKAENVDKPFVFKPCYSIASFLMVACALSLMLITLEVPMFYVPLLIFVLGACLYLEFQRSHSKKRLPIGLLRFVGAAALCGIFVLTVNVTSNFKIGEKIPNVDDVESVSVWNIDEVNPVNDHVSSSDPNVISKVIEQHQIIIDNLDKFPKQDKDNWTSYGDRLTLSYYMKDGSTITRYYVPSTKEGAQLVDDFKSAVRGLPEIQNQTTLGILGNPDLPCVEIRVENYNDGYTVKRYLKSSVLDEFATALKNDILSEHNSGTSTGSHEYNLYYTYIDSTSTKQTLYFWTHDSFEEIEKILSDPNNFVINIGDELDENSVYRVEYTLADDELPSLECSFRADNSAAQELISYFEPGYPEDGDNSEKMIVTTYKKPLYIKRENEQAALSALIRLMKELETRGEL